MPVITNANLSAINANVKTMVLESKGNIPLISDNIVKTEQLTEGRYRTYDRWVGVGEAGIVGEGANYPEKQIMSGQNKTVSVKKFGFKIGVTRELIMDNLFAPIQDSVARSAKNSMVQTKEHRVINMLNNGFSGGTQKTPDGLTLFNSAHVLLQGGTQTNVSAASTALDLDGLWEGINTMQTTISGSGLYDALYSPRYIVTPQGLQRRANELIKSEWIPQVTENTANVGPTVGGLYPMEALATPLLSSATAWFLFANPSEVTEYGLILLQREALQIVELFDLKSGSETGSVVDRDIYSWKIRERYECDTPKTWYGTFANPGA